MKKLIAVLFILLLAVSLVSPTSEASTYTLKNKSLKLPNLYSYSNAKAMKSASFKYYGVQLRQNHPTLIKMWGSPKDSTISKTAGMTGGMFTYGSGSNVGVFTMANGTSVSKNKYIIDSIVITDFDRKYELTKIKKYFGTPTSTYSSKTYKSFDYGSYLNMSFTKVGSKWYVDTLNLHKYSFQ